MTRIHLASGGVIHADVTDLTDPWRTPDTVFLHHGLGKTARYWLPWVRRLASEFRVVAIDSLGNGRSSRPRDHAWSIAGYAGDAIEVMDGLGLDRVHFVGEGLGGCVGLHLGAAMPTRVQTLTMSATPFRPSEGSTDRAAWSREIAGGRIADFVDQSLPDRMDWNRFPPGMYAWYREQRLQNSPRIYAEQMAAQQGADLEWALPLIVAPTLLIVPGASGASAHRQMPKMAERIPNARMVRFPDERQWVTFSRPDECVAAFRSFVIEVGAVANRPSSGEPPQEPGKWSR